MIWQVQVSLQMAGHEDPPMPLSFAKPPCQIGLRDYVESSFLLNNPNLWGQDMPFRGIMHFGSGIQVYPAFPPPPPSTFNKIYNKQNYNKYD